MRESTIGTRGSELALWQARWVKEKLEELSPRCRFTVKVIKTTGDKVLDKSLAGMGGGGFFTKELELALQEGSIDLAVHSMKDVPTRLPSGLVMGAITAREDVRDVLISPAGFTLDTLPPGARVGTSSLRRRAQLWHHRPDLRIEELRGNLPTRLERMKTQNLAAIILAAAGVKRLGWENLVSQYLPLSLVLPAAGQGAIGVEVREEDEEIKALVAPLHHLETAVALEAERAFLRELGGGCQVPAGAWAQVKGKEVELEGLVADLKGKKVLRGRKLGPLDRAGQVGEDLAQALKKEGAEEILLRSQLAAGASGPGFGVTQKT